MENKTVKKRGLAAVYSLCPVRHSLTLLSAIVILLHLITRENQELMARISGSLVRPIHRSLSSLTAPLPFSLAEALIVLAVLCGVVYITSQVWAVIKRDEKLGRLYRLVLTMVCAGLSLYAGFCLMWGIYYYGDDFSAQSGIKSAPVSSEELETVTRYFAALANEYSSQVQRDERNVCSTDYRDTIAKSSEVFLEVEKQYPCLEGPEVKVKPMVFSRFMSWIDFTGFFSPFTAEANVSVDYPPSMFASTVAHELSHQRGVAKEQEANFAAVLASFIYGDPDYCYSASLLAYTHLGNSLYSTDYEAWKDIYLSLNELVLADFAANREYWAQFESPVQTVSTTIYEGFLQSYDQKLGMKSYGACVDLLVNYYYESALEYFE